VKLVVERLDLMRVEMMENKLAASKVEKREN
jgi:hypothetical protein